jgi:hypothetical protein
MTPRETQYFLVTEPEHYGACRAFAKEQGVSAKFGWPTVVAVRDGEFVGLLSTLRRSESIYAGPLVLSPKAKHITVLRLIEAYEQVLQSMGASYYWFGTETPQMDALAQKMALRGGLTIVDQQVSGTLYRRDMRA